MTDKDILALVDLICIRMTAKPYTADAVQSCDYIDRLVGENLGGKIIGKIDRAEIVIRNRDDSDVFHVG